MSFSVTALKDISVKIRATRQTPEDWSTHPDDVTEGEKELGMKAGDSIAVYEILAVKQIGSDWMQIAAQPANVGERVPVANLVEIEKTD